MNHLTYDSERFYLDEKPFQIRSGAMHYFRIVPNYWRDRLQKLHACGFNTLETYTCWNLHERHEGAFDFSGILDIERYISAAEQEGLKIILRPGPYICAEWEFGGLPSWLLNCPGLQLRCDNRLFLEKVRSYYTRLFELLRPHLATNGGGIIMVQIENEYGSFGDDKAYLAAVESLYRELEVDVPLFTSDGPCDFMLNGGTLPGRLAVANFGSKPAENLALLKAFRPEQPVMCGEFWCGWFDHWYEQHHTRTADSTVTDIAEMMKMNASFNLYMFHGGTNFGFWNGANHPGTYQPTVTSYDYCAPLSESGAMTPTYDALRSLLHDETTPAPTPVLPSASLGDVALTQGLDLFAALPQLAEPICSAMPLTFEQLGQDFGFVLYSTTLHGPFEELPLTFGAVHDRAHIFVDGKLAGIVERDHRADEVLLKLGRNESLQLDILVENLGRVNYGPNMWDEKGLLGGVRLGQQYHFGWKMYRLPMDALNTLSLREAPIFQGLPMLLRGVLKVETPVDTFVRFDGFEKGFLTVNGFNIGRYWNAAGPQKTLYLPAPLLHGGENELIVFETDGFSRPVLHTQAQPDLG